jgi:hypothetical protein
MNQRIPGVVLHFVYNKAQKNRPFRSGEVFEAQVKNSAHYEVFEVDVRKL